MSALKERTLQTQNPNERHDSTIPGREYRYLDPRFINSGGAKNFNVLVGTDIAPIDFSVGPGQGEIWFVEYITLLMVHTGNMDFGVFASLGSPLTNGLLLLEKIENTEKIYTTLMDNVDVAQCFFGGIANNIGGTANDPGFLNNVDVVSGRMDFKANVVLDGNDGDLLTFRNRDDLTTLGFLGASAHIKIPRLIQSA